MTERVVLPIHGGEHCPGGPDPIPCFPAISFFRAIRWDADIVVGGTTQITVDFDEWENSNEDVFTPLDTSLNPDPEPGVDQVRRVQLEADGRYTFYFGASPTSNIAGSVELAMHDGDPIYGRAERAVHAPITGFDTAPFYVLSLSRIYPLQDPFDSGIHTKQISFTIAQNGGSSEDFIYGVMEIHYEPHVSYP